MEPAGDRLWHSLDAVTAELVHGLLDSQGIPSVVVPHGFDGVTIGHTPRDVSVLVPKGSGPRARAALESAWGKAAVDRLDLQLER